MYVGTVYLGVDKTVFVGLGVIIEPVPEPGLGLTVADGLEFGFVEFEFDGDPAIILKALSLMSQMFVFTIQTLNLYEPAGTVVYAMPFLIFIFPTVQPYNIIVSFVELSYTPVPPAPPCKT